MNRRNAFRRFLGFAAASPLMAQQVPSADDVMGPVNVHEFEDIAKKKLHKLAYDFIAGGVEDELTLHANREAFKHWFLIPRVLTDVSNVDMSTEIFGVRVPQPILVAPTGGKNLVLPSAESIVAKACAKTNTLFCTGSGAERAVDDQDNVNWWSNTTGQATRDAAVSYARRVEDRGAKAITLTVDNQYQSNRDRNNRNRFDYAFMGTGVPKPGDADQQPRNPARAAVWQPHTPNLTWDYIDWVRGATNLPVILKGVLAAEDAELAVRRGASGIIVSNHGGRQLDGAIATIDALPDVVDAVGGKLPVLMDGGIRRGSDILKALALGAQAVLVGRAPLWGLAGFGQPGVERVLWMLGAELKLSMALAGKANLAAIDRRMVRRQA
ncbi:MAG: alpha-hydroxy-acid oxidizing protein [Bryobacterales bacterium]|nr:alpha-hydroxy-acid oxidizing protein [Bryobacterales bacterium]